MGTNTIMAMIQIQANVPHKLSFCARLTNCTVATCWHVELCTLWPSPPFIQHSFGALGSVSVLSSSFRNKTRAGLGRIFAVACALVVQCPTFAYFRGKAFLGKPAKITFLEKKDVNSWIKFIDGRLYNNSSAPALGGACAMGTNTMALIQTCQIQAIMTVEQRLYFSAKLTNCTVAPMLACWTLHAQPSLRFFKHSFIRAIGSVGLLSSFRNKTRAGLGRIFAVACALVSQCLPLPISVGRLS